MGRTGLFGGTFDPIHNGHVRALKEFITECGLDRAIAMPACVPPHKKFEHSVSDADRMRMAELAVGRIAQVSDYEIAKGGKSYTIDTVRHLSLLYPDDELWLYVGSDMLRSMDGGWYMIDEILARVTVFCVSREAADTPLLLQSAAHLRDKFGAKIVLSRAEPMPVSSTQLRLMLRQGLDASAYLPAEVWQYIQEKELYRR